MDLPLLTFIFVAIFVFLEYFFNIPALNATGSFLNSTVISISYWALIYGVVNLVRHHGWNIYKKEKGEWYHSILVLGSAVTMLFAMTYYDILYQWIWNNIWYGLQTSIMCYVGFFHFSGMFRTYRARNWGGATMIISSVLGMSVNAPILLWAINPLGPAANWFSNTPAAGAWLGFHLVTGLGVFTLAARQFLGMERSMLGSLVTQEEK